MLCAIYKSLKKPGCYLYVAKRDDFSPVPDALLQAFGKPQFVMPFHLTGKKSLKQAVNQEVLQAIESQGFYLQMPKEDDGLFTSLSALK